MSETRWIQAGQKRLDSREMPLYSGHEEDAIQYCASINDSNDFNKDQFYEKLQSIMAKCLAKDLTNMMRDLNAKVGMDNTGFEDIMGERNKNG